MDEKELGCLKYEINKEMMNEVVRPILKVLCPILIVTKLVIELAAIKWRHLASAIIYLESLFFASYSMNAVKDQTSCFSNIEWKGFITFLSFVVFYTE